MEGDIERERERERDIPRKEKMEYRIMKNTERRKGGERNNPRKV